MCTADGAHPEFRAREHDGPAGGGRSPRAGSFARSAAHFAATMLVGLAGVLAVHHPMILSGFRRIQTDLGDTRLLNDLLEHGWLWASGGPMDDHFWDAPFFFPAPNVTAYSDCMLSYGPFYWPFRAAGLPPDTAFGVWMATMTALNYAAGVLLFRDGLGFGVPAAVAAAGLIAFGSPRTNQVHHPQLLPTFYVLLALYALCRIARGPAARGLRRAGWWSMFGLSVVAQLYGGYYLGWFFGVGLALAAVVALVSRPTRGRVADLALRDVWAVAAGATVAVLALIPFLSHYLPVARELGRGFNDMQRLAQPIAWSWLNPGEMNWWWGWIDRRWPVGGLYPQDLRMGVGFATTAACGLGFGLGRRRPLARIAMATTLLAATAMTFSTAHIAAAVACYALACIVREPNWGRREATILALATAALLAAPRENGVARSLEFAMMAFCGLRIWLLRGRCRDWAVPAAALAVLGCHATHAVTTLLLLAAFGPVGAVAVFFARGRKFKASLGTVGLWLAASAWMSVENEAWIFHQAVLGVAFGCAASAPPRFRAGRTPQALVLAIALPLSIAPFASDSPWLILSPFIPGSQAIRIPTRAVLMLLIPTAVGLALLVERLEGSRRRAMAWSLVLICLIEQAGTTETFDRDGSRRRIGEVARRVDRRARAFFYSPEGDEVVPYHVQIDAMWASIETGVPTINGISGCTPTGWAPLGEAAKSDRVGVERALQAWCDRHHLRRADVQLIGGRIGPIASETRPKL